MREEFHKTRVPFYHTLHAVERKRVEEIERLFYYDPYLMGYMTFNPLFPSSGQVGPSYKGEENDLEALNAWARFSCKFFDGVKEADDHYYGRVTEEEKVSPLFNALSKL